MRNLISIEAKITDISTAMDEDHHKAVQKQMKIAESGEELINHLKNVLLIAETFIHLNKCKGVSFYEIADARSFLSSLGVD